MRLIISILIITNVFSSNDYPQIVKPRKYNLKESNSLALAKEMCSCLFVSKQDEKYCREVTKESRYLGKYEIDHKRKRVKAYTIHEKWKYRAFAEFNKEKPQFGCKLTKAQEYSKIFKAWHDLNDFENYKKIQTLEKKILTNRSFRPTKIKVYRDKNSPKNPYLAR